MMSENGEKKSNEPATLLQQKDVPIGRPLDWPIVDAGGVVLFERGATLLQAEDRTFLFQHFQRPRGALDAQAATASSNEDTAIQQGPLTSKDLDLTIGMSLGIRPQIGAGG